MLPSRNALNMLPQHMSSMGINAEAEFSKATSEEKVEPTWVEVEEVRRMVNQPNKELARLNL